jgi:hypothetical protein
VIRRGHQFLLMATLLPPGWLSMMAVHEGGHFLCALFTNGNPADRHYCAGTVVWSRLNFAFPPLTDQNSRISASGSVSGGLFA